jgi:hypothetical protein
MRKSKESMESLPKTPLEVMRETKKREEEIAKEDKAGTAWNTIDPDLITPENLEIFDLYKKGEFEQAQAKKDLAKIKLKEIKDKETRDSNEALMSFLDDKIDAEIENKASRIDE